MMKRTYYMIGLLGLLSGITVASEPLSGVVFGVSDAEIEVLISSGKMPTAGMVVEVFESSDGAEEVLVGTWSVTRTEQNTAFARPIEVSGTPQLGQKAVIGSVKAKPEKEKPAVSPVEKAPPAAAMLIAVQAKQPLASSPLKKAPVETPEPLSAADQGLMDALASGDPLRIRTAAKCLYRRRYENPAVMDKAAKVLKISYNNSVRDPVREDAMAWICKALWTSKDIRHVPLLREVSREAKSRKLRSYARKYHDALVRDAK